MSISCPCPVCIPGHGLSPDCARLLRGLFRGCCTVCCVRVACVLRACCVGSCVDISCLLRGLLRQLLRDLLTGCQPDCFVICFADFTGYCPDIYQPLRQPLRGHSSLLREMFPGNCSDTARQLPVCFAGHNARCCATCQPAASCLRRGLLPDLLIQC